MFLHEMKSSTSSILLAVFIGSIVGNFAKQQYIRKKKVESSLVIQKWWKRLNKNKHSLKSCVLIQRWWKKKMKTKQMNLKKDSTWTFLFG